MFTLRKVQSERGFMSVESIANALFYLIMIAIITLIASKVMSSGKIAATASTLSMLRSNIQYVGVNAGDYSEVDDLDLALLIPGLVRAGGVLPSNYVVTAEATAAGDPDGEGGTGVLAAPDVNFFRLRITTVSPADCRKLAYYGLGGGYGVLVGVAATPTALDDPTAYVSEVEGACVPTAAGVNPDVILVSR